MDSFIILGHGGEVSGPSKLVPPGCMLVVTEECGELGTIPWQLFDVFSNPENKIYFDDPVTHQSTVEALLNKPIYIFNTGDPYPELTYTLVSYSSDYTKIEPSGVFALPTPDLRFHDHKRGGAKYELDDKDNKTAFRFAIIPDAATPILGANRSIYELSIDPSLQTTQEDLFEKMPGVYYNILCRAMNSEETHIKGLLQTNFPELDIEVITSSYDFFLSLNNWMYSLNMDSLSQKQRAVIVQIKQLMMHVLGKRKREKAGAKVFAMLNTSLEPSIYRLSAFLNAHPSNLNRHDTRFKQTPLMVAAGEGHLNAVEVMVVRGANVNARDIDGETALMYAASQGNSDVVDYLLKNGANPRLVSHTGLTLIHCLVRGENLDLIDVLVRAGVDINAVEGVHDTALHIAVRKKSVPMVTKLLEYGCNPKIPDALGNSPLITSIVLVDYTMFQLLLPLSEKNHRNLENKSAMMYALDLDIEIMVLDLIRARVETNLEKLLKVARKKEMNAVVAVVEDLLRRGGARKTKRRPFKRPVADK
jgi:hypothetical protein